MRCFSFGSVEYGTRHVLIGQPGVPSLSYISLAVAKINLNDEFYEFYQNMKQFPRPQVFVCFCEVSENSDFSGIPHYKVTFFFVLEMYRKGFKKYMLFYVTPLWLACYF